MSEAATSARPTTASTDGTEPAARTVAPAGWIPEVQGLRTLALLLVATFHIWFGRVSGGVDIFLVVSAFLMTRSLVGRLDRGAPLRPFAYIVERFARLVPLAVTTALATLALSAVLMPASRLPEYVEQFRASVLYVENRWLQNASVAYLADAGTVASPFQQFWSLSIQGQIFVIWPLLVLVIGLVHRTWHVPLRRLALWVFSTILVVGFAWSVALTAIDQPLAYFDLGARVWEFAAGSVLALVLPWLRFSPRVRGVLTWLGIAGALTCGFVLPVDGLFPGAAALWPVLSTALVIAGAGTPTDRGGDRLLRHPVMTRIGDYTYALYLVHWPLLIFALATTHTERLGLVEGTLVLLLSGVAAVVAVHAVDRPVARFVTRRPAGRVPWRALVVVALVPVLASAVVTTVQDRVIHPAEVEAASAPFDRIGPNAPGDALGAPAEDVVPDPLIAKESLGWLHTCPESVPEPDAADITRLSCQANLDEVDPATADRSVYVIGDSHAQQVTQLVAEVAGASNWAVRAYLQFGCQYEPAVPPDQGPPGTCRTMWEDATADLERNRPDAVVVLGSYSLGPEAEIELPGLAEWISHVTSLGIEVVAVRDNPRSELDMLACAERYGFDAAECSWPTTLTEPNAALEARTTESGAVYLDPNAYICLDGVCRPQVGGVIAFFDHSHVSSTYMRALAYTVSPDLSARIEWWPDLTDPART